jgi:serine/threonine-protein kinase
VSAASDEAALAVLVRDGRHADAAAILAARGELLRAAELYASVWRYAESVACAERAGRLDEAYRYALAGDDRGAQERLRALLLGHPEQALRAATTAESKGRLADAALLRDRAGDAAGAAALYERAGELTEAARLLEVLGQLREAGRLYEQRLRESPDDGEAALRLGVILARFGRYEPATRALQKAAQSASQRGAALRLLVACLDALGLAQAAASQLDELRAEDPALPLTVADYLTASFGDARGFAALARDTASAAGPDVSRWLAGRYRVVRALGSGGTGRVVLAHDAFHDRDVAIKVLNVADGAQGRDAFGRFVREARLAASIAHANVVRVFEFDPAGPFLVMEYMAGGTLEGRLAEGRALSPAAVRAILDALLEGLAAVHRRGVVHRDLKPANVFFDAAGTVKLGDFGVAHLADLGATLTGAMLGTMAYMAPEQVTGGRLPTAATDLYALGVLLVRMLTGALPFPGPDFVQQHLEAQPPRPSELRATLGDTYDALVADLLAKDPAARPQSCDELRARLAALPWPALADADVDAPLAAPASVPPPPAALASDRYVPQPSAARLHAPGLAATLARDTVLDRFVWLTPCDEAQSTFLRACAAADHPHLQAVFDVGAPAESAVLEAPAGVSLSATSALSSALVESLRYALESLHAAGIAHGSIDAAHVLVAETRAVLLLPARHAADATREDDLAALTRLCREREPPGSAGDR